LKVRSVSDSKVKVGFFGAAAFERTGDQTSLGGQGLMRACGDLANRYRSLAGRVPSDHMTAIGDIHLSMIRRPLDAARTMHPVQLRVE
jgi:hypothetical protein